MTTITKEVLRKIAPTAKDGIITDLEKYFDKHMETYGVNTYLRVCHFIAQCAHESAGFRTLEEYASGSAYEGRKDLGNVKPGDGKRYKGRGIIQLTGRSNYESVGKLLGIDLVNNPEMASLPEVSVLTALVFWNTRKLNTYADDDDVLTISKRINGVNRKTGLPNGYADRKEYLARAKKALISLKDELDEDENIVLAKRGERSNYVREIQEMLINKGFDDLVADGDFGPKTEAAVKEFQEANEIEVTGMIDTNTLTKLTEE